MKKTILTCVYVLIMATCVVAQGTLQFNRVLLITSTTAETITAGKVWKVQEYMQQNTFKFDYVNSPACLPANALGRFSGISINGITYFPRQIGQANSGNVPVSLHSLGSLWLPAGTTVAVNCANDLLSIIEFNIVP